MGVAASLFYSSNDSEKQTLLRRCTPSGEQFEEQQGRWNALAEHLIGDLKERSGHSLRTWLQGSYKFGTQIRPVHKDGEFDIDLGVYFQWTGKPEGGRHSAQTLKSFVQDSLKAYEKNDVEDVKEVCAPKTRCCRIRYRNSFHIDVPAYHLDADRDARTLATSELLGNERPKGNLCVVPRSVWRLNARKSSTAHPIFEDLGGLEIQRGRGISVVHNADRSRS